MPLVQHYYLSGIFSEEIWFYLSIEAETPLMLCRPELADYENKLLDSLKRIFEILSDLL